MKPVSFKHPLMDYLPPTPTNEHVLTLINSISQPVARQELIQHCLLAAKCSLGIILATFPQYKNDVDEMVAEAAVVVMDIIKKVEQHTLESYTNLLGYVRVYVLQRVSEMLITNTIIPIPRHQQTKLRKSGKELPFKLADLDLDTISMNAETDFEVQDALNQVISTPIECLIINLRKTRHSDKDISLLTGLHPGTIRLLRFNMYQRYLELTQ